MKKGTILMLKPGRGYSYDMPTIVKYRGIEKSGRFPFTRENHIVEEYKPKTLEPLLLAYDDLSLLLEDYDVVDVIAETPQTLWAERRK